MKRAWLAGLLVVGALAAGCGGDSDADTKDDDPTTGVTSDAGDDSGDDSGDASSSGELPKFCDLLTPDEVAGAVGAPVTLETGPFDACEFDQEDVRALSGSLGATDLGEGAGGFETYQSGTKGVLDEGATRHDFDGLGDTAYVDIGTAFGGESLQVAGGVLVGTTVYTLNLTQGSGMSEDDLVAISEKLLTLMVDAA